MKTPTHPPLLSILALAFLSVSGRAADYTVDLPPGGTWTSREWLIEGSPSGGYPSGPGDTAQINFDTSGGNLGMTIYQNLDLLALTTVGSGGFNLQMTGGGAYELDVVNFAHRSGQLQLLGGSFSVSAQTLNVEGGHFRLGFNAGTTLNSLTVSGSTTLASGAFFNIDAMTQRPKLGRLDVAGTLTISNASVNGSVEISSLTGAGTIRASNASATATAGTLYLNNTSPTPVSFSGLLLDKSTGATTAKLSIVKQGAGEQQLTGTHSYTGTTTIEAGRLTLSGSGSINASSAIVINGGELATRSSVAVTAPLTLTSGRISGTGRINQSLSIGSGQTLAPGADELTFGASQSWTQGGGLELTLTSTTGGSLAILGDLDLSALSSSQTFTLALSEGASSAWVANQTYQWTIAEVEGALLGMSPGVFTERFAFDLAQWETQGIFTVRSDGSDLVLEFVAVPEAATLSYLAAGVVVLAGWRHRNRRALK